MRGTRMQCRRLAPAALGLAGVLAVGCVDRVPTGTATGDVPLRITAPVVGTPIATLVVTVTASDIATPLVFNLAVTNGAASGTIKVPPGVARTITVQAFDDQGNVTHDGSMTLDVKPGQNPACTLHLVPRSGQIPITVTLGSYGVAVSPTSATIGVGAQRQLVVTVTDVNGQTMASPAVAWATTQPNVATVSAGGLVTGVAAGTATIAVSYEGVVATSAITVGVTIVLNPTGVTFTAVADGGSPAAQTVAVTGTGGTLSGLAIGTITYGAGASGWLAATVSPATAPATVTLTPTLGSLAAGRYTATVPVTSSAPGVINSPRNASVTLVVSAHFARLDAGGLNTCGVLANGVSYCWGENTTGAVGDGSTTNRSTPAAVAGGQSFASLVEGGGFSCGLTSAGAAWCWGANAEGQLGNGTTASSTTPVAVGGGLTFASLTAGTSHACGLTPSGVAYCWGSNGRGQIGDGSAAAQHAPKAVAGGLTFTQLSAGSDHTCGVTTGSAAWCWGDNQYGEVGDGTTTRRTVPVLVVGP